MPVFMSLTAKHMFTLRCQQLVKCGCQFSTTVPWGGRWLAVSNQYDLTDGTCQ